MKALAVMTGAEVAWPEYIETPDPSKEFEQGTLILCFVFIFSGQQKSELV